MAVVEIDHVQWVIPKGAAPAARAFYEGLLGLKECTDATLRKRGTLRYALGARRLDLAEGEFVPADANAHLALRVQGLAALLQSFRACGYAVDDSRPLPGYARVYLSDPFGNQLELLEPLPA